MNASHIHCIGLDIERTRCFYNALELLTIHAHTLGRPIIKFYVHHLGIHVHRVIRSCVHRIDIPLTTVIPERPNFTTKLIYLQRNTRPGNGLISSDNFLTFNRDIMKPLCVNC